MGYVVACEKTTYSNFGKKRKKEEDENDGKKQNTNWNVIARFNCLPIEAEDQLLCLDVVKEATTIWVSESDKEK